MTPKHVLPSQNRGGLLAARLAMLKFLVEVLVQPVQPQALVAVAVVVAMSRKPWKRSIGRRR